jgi:hypothetical protein
MMDGRSFAVHHFRRSHDSGPKDLGDGLMAKTNAQQRNLTGITAITASEMPDSFGVQGPGEITIFSGINAAISSSVSSSLRLTSTSAPSSQKYWYKFQVKES